MTDLMVKLLHAKIYEQFDFLHLHDDVMKDIKNGILYGCEDKDSMEEIFSKMIINSMTISAEISAQIILEMLLSGGVIKPIDERLAREKLFSVVKEQDSVSDNGENKTTK